MGFKGGEKGVSSGDTLEEVVFSWVVVVVVVVTGRRGSLYCDSDVFLRGILDDVIIPKAPLLWWIPDIGFVAESLDDDDDNVLQVLSVVVAVVVDVMVVDDAMICREQCKVSESVWSSIIVYNSSDAITFS
jgi:hypothetical protein